MRLAFNKSAIRNMLENVIDHAAAFAKSFRGQGFPTDVSANALIDFITAERPDLQGETFYVPSRGISSTTVMTENEVFKCAHSTEPFKVRGLKEEMRNLAQLQGSGLPIPELTFKGKKRVMFGMTRMKGVIADTVREDTPEQQRQLGIDLARFVYGVANAFPPAPRSEKSLHEVMNFTLDVLDQPRVQEIWGSDFGFCRLEISSYLDRIAGRRPVMRHKDLNDGNILIDPQTRLLSAVIDFGNMDYGHPEKEGLFLEWAVPPLTQKAGWIEYVKLNPHLDVRDRACGALIEDIKQSILAPHYPIKGLQQLAREHIQVLKEMCALNRLDVIQSPRAKNDRGLNV